MRHLFALLLICTSLPGLAHDLWIEPSSFAPELGAAVGVRLRVGQHLQGEVLPLNPELVKRFVVQEEALQKPVFTRRGAEPAGAFRVGSPGLHVVSYQSHPSRVELPAEKFDAYLLEEGLDGIAEARRRHVDGSALISERFARCAKSLVLAGPASAVQADHSLGCALELVAERNPYLPAADRDLPFRLTYFDAPLAGALVVAINTLDPSAQLSARSDTQGRVAFRLHAGGMWLIKAVHMVAAPSGTDAQWLSYWASLTFAPTAAGP